MKITSRQKTVLSLFTESDDKVELTAKDVFDRVHATTYAWRQAITQLVNLNLLKRKKLKGYNYYYYVYSLGSRSLDDLVVDDEEKKKEFRYVPCGLMLQAVDHKPPIGTVSEHGMPADRATEKHEGVYLEQSRYVRKERSKMAIDVRVNNSTLNRV